MEADFAAGGAGLMERGGEGANPVIVNSPQRRAFGGSRFADRIVRHVQRGRSYSDGARATWLEEGMASAFAIYAAEGLDWSEAGRKLLNRSFRGKAGNPRHCADWLG